MALGVDDSGALFALLDGLGHGAPAAAAAERGAEVLRDSALEPLDVLVRLCHRALAATRGAAMTLARIDFGTQTLSWIGVGNVSASVVAKRPDGQQIRSAVLHRGIVGDQIPEMLHTQQVSIVPGDLLIVTSDGVADDHLDHLDFTAPATEIAEDMLRQYGKAEDDASVLVARHRGWP